jgi:hypothetical protein
MRHLEAPLLTTAGVARELGLTPARIRQLDAELRPVRTAAGGRLYTSAAVERVRAERAAAKARR